MEYKPFRFSQELIERTVRYYKERHNVEISEDTANEYLHSFADLYLSFAELAGAKKKDDKDK
jgi:hypothetical protein